jgi:hypothetical protein
MQLWNLPPEGPVILQERFGKTKKQETEKQWD